MKRSKIIIRNEDDALKAFAALCASVESELESMDTPFAFSEGDGEGEAVAKAPAPCAAECLLALDGLEGVTVSWIVNESEEAVLVAELDEPLRVAEWMNALLDGPILPD